MMKKFLSIILTGAATFIGYDLAKTGVNTLRNPVKRQMIKNGFSNIKNAFKNEESI